VVLGGKKLRIFHVGFIGGGGETIGGGGDWITRKEALSTIRPGGKGMEYKELAPGNGCAGQRDKGIPRGKPKDRSIGINARHI